MIDALTRDGYVIISGVFSNLEIEALRIAAAEALATTQAGVLASGSGGPAYGARNLLALWPDAARLIHAPRLFPILHQVLGPRAGLVRGLYFDKPPGHSWALPWHRDQTIAVQAHASHEMFRKPTIKAGVPHVEAPLELLATMLTVRIHLDAMTAENGPLQVMVGSHAPGLPGDGERIALQCGAGDVLLMRPLLLHASGHTTDGAGHRRIVHLECAVEPNLSGGYAWHTFLPLVVPSAAGLGHP
ncbi:MAG: phytanoyl-CoA dioxygenase family protein [Gemmataceae bacterium]